jgi:hypothetical protein
MKEWWANFFYASLIGYLDLGYDIYKFVTKVLIWNDMSRAMQNPLLYMLKTSHDEPHGVWTLIDYSGAREEVFIEFHLQEYNFSCT